MEGTIIFALIFTLLGAIFFFFGLGYLLRWLAYMVRGVGMTWGIILQLVLVGSITFTSGLWMLIQNGSNLVGYALAA